MLINKRGGKEGRFP